MVRFVILLFTKCVQYASGKKNKTFCLCIKGKDGQEDTHKKTQQQQKKKKKKKKRKRIKNIEKEAEEEEEKNLEPPGNEPSLQG